MSRKMEKAIVNSVGVRAVEVDGEKSRRVMETPSTSTDRVWKLLAEGRMREERSMSMPWRIWERRDGETRGALRAMAEGGMGAGVAVAREKGGLGSAERGRDVGLGGGAPNAAEGPPGTAGGPPREGAAWKGRVRG